MSLPSGIWSTTFYNPNDFHVTWSSVYQPELL